MGGLRTGTNLLDACLENLVPGERGSSTPRVRKHPGGCCHINCATGDCKDFPKDSLKGDTRSKRGKRELGTSRPISHSWKLANFFSLNDNNGAVLLPGFKRENYTSKHLITNKAGCSLLQSPGRISSSAMPHGEAASYPPAPQDPYNRGPQVSIPSLQSGSPGIASPKRLNISDCDCLWSGESFGSRAHEIAKSFS
ncbi:hypothetical protein GWK47_023287 [Chionoecetes opilio]|uniref:Uncharacterized protein n=1 Tax=Chionoecetes opilio TaxID=41210 RepID=A0A8J4XM78_CHIOP|nr:hypothetical protein GWK47_023287 [Chionoecetes opilio]